MPHSSGGGSSGGGFHSGSSSGPSYRTSRHPFPGAYCYVYYDNYGRARTIYTNQDPKTAKKTAIGTYILFGLLALAPAAIIPLAGNHNPTKLKTDYDHTIYVQDNLHVLNEAEETKLRDTFQKFFDLSGICPGLISINNAAWKGHYSSLENYAYNAYLSAYKDESHWLIVYAADDGAKTNWGFEGMQGNDTDNILTKQVTDAFNKTCYDGLSGNTYTVAEAIDASFQSIMPTLMDHTFYVEPGIWVVCGVWEVGIAVCIVSVILTGIRNKNLKNATKIEGTPNRKKCPHCGNEYIEGTIDRCPKCQAFIDDGPKYAHYLKDGE